jgi:hypothetical protein
MKHFEKIIFKPNPDTFEVAVEEIKLFIKSYQVQMNTLTAWLKEDVVNKTKQWENINQKPLASVLPPAVTPADNELILGNGSKVTVDETAQTLTWTNTNPIYSRDCLQLLDSIQNYKLWQPGSFALHQTGKGASKIIKAYGWKNINYKKWFKKATKI